MDEARGCATSQFINYRDNTKNDGRNKAEEANQGLKYFKNGGVNRGQPIIIREKQDIIAIKGNFLMRRNDLRVSKGG